MHKRDMVVGAVRMAAHGIKHLELCAADGQALPPVEAGSHIDLWLPGGLVRQYSVIEAGADGTSYAIAVQREPHSRGGSAFIVDQLHTGTPLQMSGPRCSFRLDAGDEHSILIAGGIGITPILPMARQLQAQGKHFAFHYMVRSREQAALLDTIEHSGLQHTLHVSAEQGRADLRAVLGAPRERTGIYVCGPARLIDGVLEAARGWPANAVRFERFAAADTATPVPARAFAVELKQSGKVLSVPADQSILQVLRAEGIAMESLCGEGICGTCAVGLLSGQADHRDSLQTDDEKMRNDTIYVCVSRAQSERIVLDL